jgi:asparagine synthase (glutamine-hydrolysing)
MRRLQVIDLEGGAQPMSNEDGTLWIVFNGEIYNYRELRHDLESRGHVFRSQADTESILHLFEEEGEACLGRLHGMFAVAVWDTRRRRLVVARDRLGKKPLYYARDAEGGLSFASELTALLEDGDVERRLDPRALDEFLTYLFVPHPRTPYAGVHKLPPATVGVWEAGSFTTARYWAPEDGAAAAPANARIAVEELDALVSEAVRCRLHADVPLGAFLSGGLDSSLVVAMMARQAPGRVRTFSIGFEEASFSETAHARRVAQILGTEHEEFVVGWDVAELLPTLGDHFGEPFADSSAIPTYHLSRQTRAHVTVALSGDGGDEVFGGYRRYQARCWTEFYNEVPNWLGRNVFESLVRRLPEPPVYYGESLRKKVKRFCEFAGAVRCAPHTSWAFFLSEAEKRALYGEDFAEALRRDAGRGSYAEALAGLGATGVEAMMRFDLVSYLPDDILAKVDRMSMACSLEVRSPLLDHRVVEFAHRLPRPMKVGLGYTKRILRQLARRYLPEDILRRPKHGFAVPLDAWLRGPLRPWLQEQVLAADSRVAGLVQPRVLREMVERHAAGRRDLSQQLWALLVLELWLRRTRMSL